MLTTAIRTRSGGGQTIGITGQKIIDASHLIAKKSKSVCGSRRLGPHASDNSGLTLVDPGKRYAEKSLVDCWVVHDRCGSSRHGVRPKQRFY
jgi:hypothetical protein